VSDDNVILVALLLSAACPGTVAQARAIASLDLIERLNRTD
jgi:hypothetical protein